MIVSLAGDKKRTAEVKSPPTPARVEEKNTVKKILPVGRPHKMNRDAGQRQQTTAPGKQDDANGTIAASGHQHIVNGNQQAETKQGKENHKKKHNETGADPGFHSQRQQHALRLKINGRVIPGIIKGVAVKQLQLVRIEVLPRIGKIKRVVFHDQPGGGIARCMIEQVARKECEHGQGKAGSE